MTEATGSLSLLGLPGLVPVAEMAQGWHWQQSCLRTVLPRDKASDLNGALLPLLPQIPRHLTLHWISIVAVV